jgi:hypothetical protein
MAQRIEHMGLFKQQRDWYGSNLYRYFPSVDDRINDRAAYAAYLRSTLKYKLGAFLSVW